jgi:hypothetical protein
MPPNDTFRGGAFLTQRDHEEYSPDGTDHEDFSASTSNDTNKVAEFNSCAFHNKAHYTLSR